MLEDIGDDGVPPWLRELRADDHIPGRDEPRIVLERFARGLDREGVPPACEVVLGDPRLDGSAEGAAWQGRALARGLIDQGRQCRSAVLDVTLARGVPPGFER